MDLKLARDGRREPRIVFIRPEAPPKPPVGDPCNGCGLCCLSEPCPLGILVSRRRHGACAAVTWNPDANRWRCGVLATPSTYVQWLPARWTQVLATRWIAAGTGCDAEIEPA